MNHFAGRFIAAKSCARCKRSRWLIWCASPTDLTFPPGGLTFLIKSTSNFIRAT